MTALANISTNIGGAVHQYTWHWQQQAITVIYETLGQGLPVLLLPAFSTVSTREEMGEIAQGLAAQYQVFAVDWPGFGQSQRLPLDYQPKIYQQFLEDFVQATFNAPIILIAAGHAAGYALKLANAFPDKVSKLILIAPTWLGPFKAMGMPKPVRQTVKQIVRTPLLGEFLYYLNTTPSFLSLMYRRHVYTDESKLTSEFIEHKRQVTQQQGARYAPAAFVTGTIDPVSERSEFLTLCSSLSIPILLILAEQAPPQSKAEMEATAALGNVQTVRLPGTLGIHEENADLVTQAILQFL